MEQARNEIGRIATIDEGQLEILISRVQSANEVADADLAEIAGILEIDDAAAQSVIDGADAVVEALVMEEAERRNTVEDLPEEVDVPQEPTDDLPEEAGDDADIGEDLPQSLTKRETHGTDVYRVPGSN